MKKRIFLFLFISVIYMGCASAPLQEDYEESLENPIPYKIAMAPVVLGYLKPETGPSIVTGAKAAGKGDKTSSNKTSRGNKSSTVSSKEKKWPKGRGHKLKIDPQKTSQEIARKLMEHKIFASIERVETPKVRSTKKRPLTYLNSSQLQEIFEWAKKIEAQMVVIPTVDNYEIRYLGFNGLWWLSINAWWFLFGSHLWIPDEDFSISMDLSLDFYSTQSKSLIYSESFHGEAFHSMSDWSSRMGIGEIIGYTMLAQKEFDSQELEPVQQSFLPEVKNKIYYQMVRTLIRKFVPYSKTSKFLSDLNGVGFPPTIKIDLEPNQKFDLPEAQVDVSLGDDRGIKEVRFRLYESPTPNPTTWKEIPSQIKIRPLDQKLRFRRYKLTLRFPKLGKYILRVECKDEDQNDGKWEYSLEHAEIERKLVAVVIGVGQYKKKNIPPLRFAAKDAHDLAQLLQAKKDELHLKKLIELTQEKATLEEIRHALGTVLAKEATPYDTVFIFYSGHGVAVPDPASPDKDKMEKYFVPYDVDKDSWYSSALPMGELQRILNRIDSRRVMIFLDSCYSGSGAKSLSGSNVLISPDFQNRFKRRGLLVVTASDTNQYSYESEKLQNGYFTYFLIQGLKGDADQNGDSKVTANELVQYLKRKVPEAVKEGENQIQTPTVTNLLYGDFVLLQKSRKRSGSPSNSTSNKRTENSKKEKKKRK
ncbi:MAG: caspase family protein [Planctomycetota bacterium]|nr:MAG: caspase family protein [Planctomycetota bacterium]